MLGAATFLIVASAAGQSTQSVTLAWNANAEADLAGYILYFGQASRSYSSNLHLGKVTNNTVAGLRAGSTYYFAVSAYNTPRWPRE